MATELVMPQLDMSMTSGQLGGWLVADGAHVRAGQAIYTVEAEKATQDIEAPVSGILTQIAVVGEIYEVGAKLGEIRAAGE